MFHNLRNMVDVKECFTIMVTYKLGKTVLNNKLLSVRLK